MASSPASNTGSSARLSGLRDYILYIADIEEAIGKMQAYTRGPDEDIFRRDSKTYDSVIHNLFIIGEAAGKIPADTRERHP